MAVLDIKKYVINKGVFKMANSENIFVREFNTMMNQRRSQNSGFSITDIPYPDLHLITKDDFVKGGKWGFVKNISEPYFNDLNKSEVEIVKGRSFEKKLAYFDSTGKVQYKTDKNGDYITNTITVEKGFVAIYSSVNIHLPNKIERNGIKKDYKPTFGYNFIEYVDSPKGRKYLYTVPMQYVYPVELCGLVIALNKHRAYYKGCKVALTNGYHVYIYSIPYKYRENQGYVLIGAKSSPNFDEEMNKLLDYWMREGILFDLDMTALENQIKGSMNVGIQDIPGTCLPSEYQMISSSLNENDLENLEERTEIES